MKETIENYYQVFVESDANDREKMLDILRDLAEKDKSYLAILIQLENYEREEVMNYLEDGELANV